MLVTGLAFAAGVLYFFWPSFIDSFSQLSGDLGDGRLLNTVAEHWYLVVRGTSAWRDMEMYYPQRGVLGYGDALVLFAPPYIALRLAGVPYLYAYAATLVVILGTGYAATVWFLRRVIGVGTSVAIAGALMFAFSNMNMLKLGHSQLYAAAFVPLVLGLLWLATARLTKGHTDFCRPAVAFAILLPLLLYTGFYIGWYTGLFVAIWGLVLLATKRRVEPATVLAFFRQVREQRIVLAGLVLVLAIALLPFVLTYLPVLRDIGGRSWDEVKLSLPSFGDFINVGSWNYAWGWLARGVVPPDRPLAHELWLGMPVLLMASFLIVQSWLALRLVRSGRGGQTLSQRDQAVFAMGIATLIGWVMMVEVNNISLWKFVFGGLPGGSAIRAVFRYQFVLHFAVIVVVAIGLDRVRRLRRFRIAFVIALAALPAEQLTANRSRFEVRETNRRLAAIPAPPVACRFFLIERERDGAKRPAFHLQVEAVVIAQKTGLPTINGYSANLPPFWGPDLIDVRSPGYVDAALTWLSHHNLREGLCLLDLQSNSWRMPQMSWSDLRGRNLIRRDIRSFEEGMAVALKGFYPIEAKGRWTHGAGQIALAKPVDAVKLQIRGNVHNQRSQVRIAVDGTTVHDQLLEGGPFVVDVALAGAVSTIDIGSSSFVPRALGINNDTRLLGVSIESVILK